MKRYLSVTAVMVAATFVVLSGYAAWWAVAYRLPPRSRDEIIDLRASKSQSPYYVTFCAGLARNHLGFPGHAFVIWSRTANWQESDVETRSFVPAYAKDQIPSLASDVPGLLLDGGGEQRIDNPEAITVIVSGEEYEKTRKMSKLWSPSHFRTGVRDCVAFVDYVAKDVGLVTPERGYSYPQDHIKELKLLNGGSATGSALARSRPPGKSNQLVTCFPTR